MKKSLSPLIVLIVIATMLSACVAATPAAPQVIKETVVVKETAQVPAAPAAKPGGDRVLIGYAAPALVGGQEWLISNTMDDVEKLGWKMIVANSNGDAQKQNDDVDFLISMGTKAIIAVPNDSAAICTAAKKAKEAGVLFVTEDRSPSGCAIDMTVLSDNRMAGRQGGEVMADALKAKYGEVKGTVLEITGDLSQNVGQLRRDGFHDVMDQYPGVKVIQKVGNWDAAKGQQIVRDVLNGTPELDGIYMHSEVVYGAGTQAVLQELNRWKKAGEDGHIIITGVDGGPWLLQSVWDGYAEGTGSQPSRYFTIAVEMIDKLLKGEKIAEGEFVKEGALWSPAKITINADGTPEMMLGTLKVDKSNIKDPLAWSYHYPDLKPPEQ